MQKADPRKLRAVNVNPISDESILVKAWISGWVVPIILNNTPVIKKVKQKTPVMINLVLYIVVMVMSFGKN